MISPKKNKNSTLIIYLVSFLLLFLLFYFLFNQFAIADTETRKDNFSINKNTALKINNLDLLVNDPDPDINYPEVTNHISLYTIKLSAKI